MWSAQCLLLNRSWIFNAVAASVSISFHQLHAAPLIRNAQLGIFCFEGAQKTCCSDRPDGITKVTDSNLDHWLYTDLHIQLLALSVPYIIIIICCSITSLCCCYDILLHYKKRSIKRSKIWFYLRENYIITRRQTWKIFKVTSYFNKRKHKTQYVAPVDCDTQSSKYLWSCK